MKNLLKLSLALALTSALFTQAAHSQIKPIYQVQFYSPGVKGPPPVISFLDAAATVTLSTLNFPNTQAGTTSAPLTMTLKNTGTAPVVFGATPLTVYAPYTLVAGSTCTGTLAVNATCTASFTFSPPAVGTFNGKYLALASTPTPRVVIPFYATAPSPIVEVVSGGASYSTIVKRQDGTWWGTGSNSNGELGLGSTTAYYYSYVPLPALAGAVKVYTNGGSTFAIMGDGSVKASGGNKGNLGLGDMVNRTVFTTVTGITAQKIVLGFGSATYLQKLDGTWWGAAQNASGELGLGDTAPRTTFVPLALPANTVSLVAGYANTFVQNATGNWFAVGENYYGQLGIGDRTNRSTFTSMPIPAGSTIVPSYFDTFVRYSNSSWAEAGWNLYVVNDNGIGSYINPSFVGVSSLNGAVSLAAGVQTFFARFPDNSVKGAGWDYGGGVGGGYSTQQLTFFTPPGVAGTTTVSPSLGGTVGLMPDGTLVVTGYNKNLGIGISDSSIRYRFFQTIQ